jgi:hypothetical protein
VFVPASAAVADTLTLWSHQPGQIVVEFDDVDVFLTQEARNTSLATCS